MLALACDRAVENGDGLEFGDVLVADLGHRATIDASGARWSNLEYRASRPELEPRPGWAMGPDHPATVRPNDDSRPETSE